LSYILIEKEIKKEKNYFSEALLIPSISIISCVVGAKPAVSLIKTGNPPKLIATFKYYSFFYKYYICINY